MHRLLYRSVKTDPLTDEVCAKEQLGQLDTTVAVRQALASLSDDLRELLMLRFANELSINEICNVTLLSRFAVYRNINAALKSLRHQLREEDSI